MSSKTVHVGFGLFLAAALAALVWPVYPLVSERAGDRQVLGLSFPFFWSTAWVVATFLALLAYHRASGGGRE